MVKLIKCLKIVLSILEIKINYSSLKFNQSQYYHDDLTK